MNIWLEYVKDWKSHSKEELIMQVISVVLILILGLIAVKLIGKKSIARLNLIDVLFIFILSSTLGALITKPNRIFVALLVVATIVLFVFIMHRLQLKVNTMEKMLQGSPEVVFKDGQFHEQNLKRNNLTIDTLESAIRQHGLPSFEVCKLIAIESTGTLSFQVKPEYEPIKKIYFDAAMQQILQAVNESKYQEIKLPEMQNAFDEIHNQVTHKSPVPKQLD